MSKFIEEIKNTAKTIFLSDKLQFKPLFGILIIISVIWQLSFWSVYDINPFEFHNLTTLIASTLTHIMTLAFYVTFGFISFAIFSQHEMNLRKAIHLTKVFFITFILIIITLILMIDLRTISNLISVVHYLNRPLFFTAIPGVALGISYSLSKSLLEEPLLTSEEAYKYSRLKPLTIMSLAIFILLVVNNARVNAEINFIPEYQKKVAITYFVSDSIVTEEKIHIGILGEFIFVMNSQAPHKIDCIPMSDIKKITFSDRK